MLFRSERGAEEKKEGKEREGTERRKRRKGRKGERIERKTCSASSEDRMICDQIPGEKYKVKTCNYIFHKTDKCSKRKDKDLFI